MLGLSNMLEHPAIEGPEITIGREKHKAARLSHNNSGRLAPNLDSERLRCGHSVAHTCCATYGVSPTPPVFFPGVCGLIFAMPRPIVNHPQRYNVRPLVAATEPKFVQRNIAFAELSPLPPEGALRHASIEAFISQVGAKAVQNKTLPIQQLPQCNIDVERNSAYLLINVSTG